MTKTPAEKVLKALGEISRMSISPDNQLTRFTLMAARKTAENALPAALQLVDKEKEDE